MNPCLSAMAAPPGRARPCRCAPCGNVRDCGCRRYYWDRMRRTGRDRGRARHRRHGNALGQNARLRLPAASVRAWRSGKPERHARTDDGGPRLGPGSHSGHNGHTGQGRRRRRAAAAPETTGAPSAPTSDRPSSTGSPSDRPSSTGPAPEQASTRTGQRSSGPAPDKRQRPVRPAPEQHQCPTGPAPEQRERPVRASVRTARA